jgi:D-alanine transaminase
VLAKQAAADAGAAEAILVRDGVVTEGSHTNVFAVDRGMVRTHPANNLILHGVTRQLVIDLARSLDLEVQETPFMRAELAAFDELFLVGTTTDVMPLVRVDEHTVGNGSPGPIATRLQAALRARLDAGVSDRRAAALVS